MNKNDLKVYDYVVDITLPHVIGQVQYGAWKNENIGIDHTQYGAYILWYDRDWYRIGFDNTDWNYITRTDLRFPTMPQS